MSLIHLFKAILIDAFQSEKDHTETCISQELHNLIVFTNHNRCLSGERHRAGEGLIPFDNFLEQFHRKFPVHNKIVIGKKNGSRSPGLGVLDCEHYLVNRFAPVFSSGDMNNVAEITSIGATAAGLEGEVMVIFRTDMGEVRIRRVFYIDKRLLPVGGFCIALNPIS